MDYPKSIPGVGLVDGHFVDENPTTGQIGSLIPAAWGDAITQEVLNVIKAAGMVPSESNVSQLTSAVLTIAASDFKRSALVATTGPVALSGLQTIDGVALIAGARVLVKNQANAAQNWIYVVSAGAWTRAQDADDSAECTPGHLIGVQAGTVNSSSVWQLTNTAAPVLGTTALNFAQVLGKTGVVAGEYRRVIVDALGRVTAGSNPTTLAEYGITNALRTGTTDQVPRLYASTPGSDYSTVPIEIREAQLVGAAQKGFEYSPRLGFHWSSVVAGSLAMESNGVLCWNGYRIWDANSFDPDKKANKATTLSGYGINNAYTSVQVDNLLTSKLSRDSIVSAGFQNNNPNLPYMLRESDMGMYFLQPRLGFVPVQQGGGVGQLPNTIKIGYSLEGVRITIDESDAGVIWTSGNFNPASKADATAVAQATEVGRGTARVAAIADVNAGVDDAAFVTSKKLRWGFSASLAINGYIALPSWLGGLVIQWGRSDLAGSQFGNVAFPVAFPNNGFIALAVDAVVAGTPSTLSAVGVTVPTTAGFSLVSASASAAGIQMWAAIGN